jgi:hypothetical protein
VTTGLALPGLGQQTTPVLSRPHPVQTAGERGDQRNEVLKEFVPATELLRVQHLNLAFNHDKIISCWGSSFT